MPKKSNVVPFWLWPIFFLQILIYCPKKNYIGALEYIWPCMGASVNGEPENRPLHILILITRGSQKGSLIFGNRNIIRRILEIMFCRILVVLWSFGPRLQGSCCQKSLPANYVGGCQNHGTFLGSKYNTAPSI